MSTSLDICRRCKSVEKAKKKNWCEDWSPLQIFNCLEWNRMRKICLLNDDDEETIKWKKIMQEHDLKYIVFTEEEV